MIDERKRKLLVYLGMGFVVIVVIALVVYGFINNSSDLPPVEDTQTQNSNSDESSGTIPSAPTTEDSAPIVKDGIAFNGFNKLQLYSITAARVDVIVFTLAGFAANQTGNSITSYAFDETSLSEATEGERHIFTFHTTADNGKTYKVELSYTYSADAYVRVFDGENVVKTSY